MQEKKKAKNIKKRIITAVFCLAVIAVGVAVFLNADTIFPAAELEFEVLEKEPFTYETGSGQAFAAAGDGLAVVTSSSAQLFDSAGKSVAKQVHSFDSPAVAASAKGAVFFDVGARRCCFAGFDGEFTEIEVTGAVISASINDSGYFTVITEEAGYKALVSVYDPDCNKLYEWHSGTGYAVKAEVCPNNRSFAVLCITSQGSEIHIFSFTSETEKAKLRYDNLLLFDMYFMSTDRLCAIGNDGLYFSNTGGEVKGEHSFEGMYLCGYSFGSTDFAAVYLSEYRTGVGGTLRTVSPEGEALGETRTDKDVTCISANGKNLLLMTTGGIYLYSRDMALQQSNEELMTYKKAFLRSKSDVLLISSFNAEIFTF